MHANTEVITVSNYHSMKGLLSNLDLIMFRGDDIISDTIAELQKCDMFTHVGLVIKSDLLPDCHLDPDRLYILESTYSYEISGMDNGPPDYLTNQQHFGVQLRDLELVCNSYIYNAKTKMVWFQLDRIVDTTNFSSIFQRYHMKPFIEQKMSMIDFTRITPEILAMTKLFMTPSCLEAVLKDSFSCVNLVTSIYRDLNIISSDVSITYPIELLQLFYDI